MVELSGRNDKRVGVELSGSDVRAVVIANDGEIVTTALDEIVRDDGIVSQVVGLVERLGKEFGPFGRLGVAVPGLVDRETGRVAFSANAPAHSGVDLAAEIRAASGIEVAIENDANAAAYGEFRIGAGSGSHNMFYATLGEGVGGAFIFGDEIWRGVSGFAGEFGYITINSEGMRLEDVASAANIIRRTRNRFHQDSTSSLSKMSEDEITLDAILAAAEKDDDFARMMLERTGSYVGAAIAGVINLLNIEKVVLGGEIMQANGLVLDAAIERARELAFAPAFASTSIVAGNLGRNAAAAGAALICGEVC
ncbi:MAG: ROK family protein [Pyrinomonadaceae bacterium]